MAGKKIYRKSKLEKPLLHLVCVCCLWLLPTIANSAVELLMIEQAGCVYCEKFNDEIAQAYPKTDEGKLAPLRRVDLHDKWPEDLSQIRIERFTPTFVLVQDGKEVDRLRGYPGDEYFWFLLGEMLAKLNPSQE